MNVEPLGIHHVTAVASDPQRNVEFYLEVLGLRLVKQTVNFDAPDTYHLTTATRLGARDRSSRSSPGPVPPVGAGGPGRRRRHRSRFLKRRWDGGRGTWGERASKWSRR